jgi:predicted transcriptional regulator of viral defense system
LSGVRFLYLSSVNSNGSYGALSTGSFLLNSLYIDFNMQENAKNNAIVSAQSITSHVVELVRISGFVRARDIAAAGIDPTHLQRLYEAGVLVRPSRGIYAMPNHADGENASLQETMIRFPNAAVCLLSALRFHGIGTQNPQKLWLAVQPRTHHPSPTDVALQVVQMKPELFGLGILTISDGKNSFRITTPARTIVDCFRYRNKIGIDVAIEAMVSGFEQRLISPAELDDAIDLCRVRSVIQPYLEALASR